MLGSAIGSVARKIGSEVATKLGQKTAEKVTRKAGVVKPRGEKPFRKKVAKGSRATVSRVEGKDRATLNAKQVSGMNPPISKKQAEAKTAAFAKARAAEMAKNTKVIAKRRGKDIAGTGAFAGAAGYLGGKKKK